jgi:hypothetical protein
MLKGHARIDARSLEMHRAIAVKLRASRVDGDCPR